MLYRKCLASALPLGLLGWRAAAVLRQLEAYRQFWSSGAFDWLHMPFPYAIPIFLLYAAFVLFVRWGPFLVPLGSAAAPWLPRRVSRWVYLGCAAACVPVFLGEGFLYLVRLLAQDSRGHLMPLADLILLGMTLFGMYLTGQWKKNG